MARSERGEEPVTEEEFEMLPELISEHFDRMRALMEQALEEQE